MIRVNVQERLITISGHANFADYGKDIVCSSVSSIVTTSINAILMLNRESIEYQDVDSILTIKILQDSDITNKLIKNMLNMLRDLESDYPNNVKIIEMRNK